MEDFVKKKGHIQKNIGQYIDLFYFLKLLAFIINNNNHSLKLQRKLQKEGDRHKSSSHMLHRILEADIDGTINKSTI